jgi:hypothetical protein
MKVANTRKVNERIVQYMSREQLNSLLGMGLSAPVSVDEIIFEEPDKLLSYAESFRQQMEQNGLHYTEDQSVIAAMVMSVLEESVGDPQKVSPAVLDEIFKNSHIFHKGELESNPYYQNIHFDNQKQGRFELSMASFRRYELFMYDTPKDRFQGVMIPAIGTVDHRFKFPNIKENGSVWMSITPNEIFTMQKPIEDASGKVLTLGCGMGYFAYMTALKDNVEHVTIIEKQPEVIELFNTFILPQFPCKDKITVIQADAFDYMEALADGEYDYCFVDIWKGNTDTVPYLEMKKLCSRFKKTTLSYWIEDALIATIIGFVYMIILEEFYKNQNIDAPQISELPEDESYKLEYLKELLRDVEITRPEHVDYYMDYHNIINLMS